MNNFYKTKKEIKNWLDKYKISDYEIVPDDNDSYVVNVKGDVDISLNNISFIPVKFNRVQGNFYCFSNKLTSLQGCPETVWGGFLCQKNKLTSLEFCPSLLLGEMDCSDNKLKSLKFSPKYVENFFCENNLLISLEFCPNTIENNFSCRNNLLESLEFCPQKVGGHFFIMNNARLEKFQNVINFDEIYQEYLRIQSIKQFNCELEKQLLNNPKKSKLYKI